MVLLLGEQRLEIGVEFLKGLRNFLKAYLVC
jgi:hypothetical protein